MPIVTIGSIFGGGGSPPITFEEALFTPTVPYTVRIEKPNVTVANHSEYRWVREGAWSYVEIPLGVSGGPDSPSLTFGVNAPGQVKVEIDRWQFAQIWDAANFNEGGAPIRFLVPESVTMWVFRGTQPLWGGFLMDIDADPAGSPNITLTGEEFIGQYRDICRNDPWTFTGLNTYTVLDEVLASELRTAWMHAHYHAYPGGTFDGEYTRSSTTRLGEIIDQLATAGDFEYQQWIGPAAADGTWEAYFGVHPGGAGYDFTTQGLSIEWGQGTTESAHQVRYTFSGRNTRTQWTVVGKDDETAIRYYNIPLGMPRRDGVERNADIPAGNVPTAAVNLLQAQGLPQLTARAVLRVGDQAPGQWPFLWLFGNPGFDGTGGCSPVGSKFYVRIVDATMVYSGVMRASTWGIAIVPGGEFMVMDLVQDKASSAGLLLDVGVVP